MEMQFDKIPMPYLKKLAGGLRSQEQTLEVRLPEGMPDIGHVLGAWGQVVVRSKEWNGDTMGLSCGVTAWVLYTPEDEDGVYSVEAWLPFAMKWDLPDARHDGKILVNCLLRSVDARSTSDRKLMVRATLDAVGEGWLPDQAQVAVPAAPPEDVELLTQTYPVLLPKEAGEKSFLLEESLEPPTAGVKPEKLLYYCLQPEILDKKVMADKVVFRGNGNLHVLCLGENGKLFTCDFDLPFSQYGELEGEYDGEPMVSVRPCVTSVNLALDENGVLQLKTGLLGQYLLCDRCLVTVAEDAYSPRREVKLMQEQLQLPAILDRMNQTVHGEHSVSADVRQVVDVSFCASYGQTERTDTGLQMSIPGRFQMLYYDADGVLCGTETPWEGEWSIPVADSSNVDNVLYLTGRPQAVPGAGNVNLRADIGLDSVISAGQGIPMVTEIELGELVKPNSSRPSLVLCRKGDKRLWDVAKQNGSTVAKIMEANHLEEEPESNRILLIPVS